MKLEFLKWPPSKAPLLAAALSFRLFQAAKIQLDATNVSPKILADWKYYKLWETTLGWLCLKRFFNRWKLRQAQVTSRSKQSYRRIQSKPRAAGTRTKEELFPLSKKTELWSSFSWLGMWVQTRSQVKLLEFPKINCRKQAINPVIIVSHLFVYCLYLPFEWCSTAQDLAVLRQRILESTHPHMMHSVHQVLRISLNSSAAENRAGLEKGLKPKEEHH